jgi:TctA family transporter
VPHDHLVLTTGEELRELVFGHRPLLKVLLVLNLPLIPIWVKILRIPHPGLFPLILLLCLIGAYSLNDNLRKLLIWSFWYLWIVDERIRV